MYDVLLQELSTRKKPLDVIMAGLGFMGFGFLSATKHIPGIRVPLVITRDVMRSQTFLAEQGYQVAVVSNPGQVNDQLPKDTICISDNYELIKDVASDAVLEVTGTVDYGTQVALMAIEAGKPLVTMNPELQVTVGSVLKSLAQRRGTIVSDVHGDQPGSLIRMISHARLMGFNVLMAGNMKRFMNLYATQAEMEPWAKDKGLATRQTVSFTDGTKQAIEMTLVGNYLGFEIAQPGMIGPKVNRVSEALDVFDWGVLPKTGIVDYTLGLDLFPGIFLVVEHPDPAQTKYLRYLGLGNGPRYVLFEPYHLCHLEVAGTIAQVVLHHKEVIDNTPKPHLHTVARAKKDLQKGEVLDGIGGDTVYGVIETIVSISDGLAVGLSHGAVLKTAIAKDQPIQLSDVILPDTPATRLLKLNTK